MSLVCDSRRKYSTVGTVGTNQRVVEACLSRSFVQNLLRLLLLLLLADIRVVEIRFVRSADPEQSIFKQIDNRSRGVLSAPLQAKWTNSL